MVTKVLPSCSILRQAGSANPSKILRNRTPINFNQPTSSSPSLPPSPPPPNLLAKRVKSHPPAQRSINVRHEHIGYAMGKVLEQRVSIGKSHLAKIALHDSSPLDKQPGALWAMLILALKSKRMRDPDFHALFARQAWLSNRECEGKI